MKHRLTALALLAILTLCSCTTGSVQGETSTPPSPSGTPVEYDFSEVEVDEHTASLTGFQGLPWGYQLPRELVADTGSAQLVTLRNSGISFAGLDFQAEYLFSYTQSIPDLTPEDRVLTVGQFVRQGYAHLNGQPVGTESAVSDFNQVMAYLTQLFGQPTQYVLSHNGSSSDDLTSPLTAAQFSGEDVTGAQVFWNDLDGAAVSLRLSSSYGGMLSVVFSQKK